MIKYCPYCGKENVQKIGISGIGNIHENPELLEVAK